MATANGVVDDRIDVYATLLLTDSYLPGALVLAHSLRDAGTTKKLAVLVTPDTVSREVVEELKALYDFIIPVDRVENTAMPQNLDLMDRPDLHSAFTKINLWKLTQFRKIVYLDADTLALRAPEELFDIEHPFSAAPDIGWPDIFNTGAMVLNPNTTDHEALSAMAAKGESFDGADQGLLNQYFRNNYNRLSFAYNVTPSAHYQYLPAYRHFEASINVVHFIGPNKPWTAGRPEVYGKTPYDEMVAKWWTVYDRHYGVLTPPGTPGSEGTKRASDLVRYFVKGEYRPSTPGSSGSYYRSTWDASKQAPPQGSKPEAENLPQHHYQMSQDPNPFVPPQSYPSPPTGMWYEVPRQAPAPSPPAVFPWEHRKPQVSRVFHDDPPRAVMASPPPFPRSTPQPAPPPRQDDGKPAQPSPRPVLAPIKVTPPTRESRPAPLVTHRPSPPPAPQLSDPDMTEASTTDHRSDDELLTPVTPTRPLASELDGRVMDTPPIHRPAQQGPTQRPMANMWSSFTQSNVWDDVPEIQRYADRLSRRHQRTKSVTSVGQATPPPQVGQGSDADDDDDDEEGYEAAFIPPPKPKNQSSWRMGASSYINPFAKGARVGRVPVGSRVTDFPSEAERPSLPVTPNPIPGAHRPQWWWSPSGEQVAWKRSPQESAGVPSQNDWVCVHGHVWGPDDCLCTVANVVAEPPKNPAEALQKLAWLHEQVMRPRAEDGGHDDASVLADGGDQGGRGSPDQAPSGSPVGTANVETTASVAPAKKVAVGIGSGYPIPEPSYHGPGAAWERGEDVPIRMAPVPPSEEEMDVLQT